MSASGAPRRARLSIDIEPELRRKIKIAATEKDLSVRDYAVGIIHRELATEGRNEALGEGASWAQLSARSFARDWDSEEDRVSDELSQG